MLKQETASQVIDHAIALGADFVDLFVEKNETGSVSTLSKKVQSAYAIAVNSATSALHTACLALGLGTNDLIWTSPITFVASANCGIYCGANVDFVDIDPLTGLMCMEKLNLKLDKMAL